jgi:hypothetical protein
MPTYDAGLPWPAEVRDAAQLRTLACYVAGLTTEAAEDLASGRESETRSGQ